MSESDSACESLFGIVVTETDLQLDSLDELTFLSFGEHLTDSFLQKLVVDLRHQTKGYPGWKASSLYTSEGTTVRFLNSGAS